MAKKIKHPTPEELEFYRRKAESGSFIGKNQLAQVFMALDHHADDAAKLRKACRELCAALGVYLEVCKPADPDPRTFEMEMYLKGKGAVRRAEEVL